MVEVAVYPQKDNFVKISAADFILREAGIGPWTRASSANDVAASLQLGPKEPDRAHGPVVTQTSEIGYGRTTGNAPIPWGSSNRNGVYTRQSVGVGVGVGGVTSGSSAGGSQETATPWKPS